MMHSIPCECIKKQYDRADDKKTFCGIATTKCTDAKKGFHRHHWSYNREHLIDVVYVDKSYHQTFHSYMTYDRQEKMYRVGELHCSWGDKCFQGKERGELLDTKFKHLRWLVEVKNHEKEERRKWDERHLEDDN